MRQFCLFGVLVFVSVTLASIDESYNRTELLSQLQNHPAFIRLKYIDQSGPLCYFAMHPKFSRYEHSIGVYNLLCKAGISFRQQVVGLLHDISHTAFSHVADHLLYKDNQKHSYQDIVHLAFLHKMGIDALVTSYMTLEEMDPDLPEYSALERPHPELCADRLQYIVYTAFVYGDSTQSQMDEIFGDVQFDGNSWFFRQLDLAKKVGMWSIKFTKTLWGSEWNHIFYQLFSQLLQYAIALKLIKLDDILYGTDDEIIVVLRASNDPIIKNYLSIFENIDNYFVVVPYGNGTWNVKPKCRAVDPLILLNNELVHLSEVDSEFFTAFNEIVEWCNVGYGINLVNVKDMQFAEVELSIDTSLTV